MTGDQSCFQRIRYNISSVSCLVEQVEIGRWQDMTRLVFMKMKYNRIRFLSVAHWGSYVSKQLLFQSVKHFVWYSNADIDLQVDRSSRPCGHPAEEYQLDRVCDLCSCTSQTCTATPDTTHTVHSYTHAHCWEKLAHFSDKSNNSTSRHHVRVHWRCRPKFSFSTLLQIQWILTPTSAEAAVLTQSVTQWN